MNGNLAGMKTQGFNAGTTELTALIMFVADATIAFPVPVRLP